MARASTAFSILALAALAVAPALAAPQELLYASEGNRLRRYDIDTIERGGPVLEEIVIENAKLDPERGRDINGMVCELPDGSGRLVAGEDSGQPHPPAGWGILTPDGNQVGKLTATALYEVPDPHGCAFDPEGRLFTSETGNQFFDVANGQLIVWFPPFVHFPGPPGAYPATDATSSNYCKLATDIGTATGVAVDGQGRVYVAAASGLEVLRFWPPFPTGPDAAGGCGAKDVVGSPMAAPVRRERFLGPLPLNGLLTYSGLALAPNGNLYVASVVTGRIGEFDLDGDLVRMVLEPSEFFPPFSSGYPQGLAVDSRGTLYYADLDLRVLNGEIEPGPDGKVWRIPFDDGGNPLPPEVVAAGLAFPDGLGVVPGDLEQQTAPVRPGTSAVARPVRVQGGAEAEPRDEPGGDAGGLFLGLLALIVLAVVGRRFFERREREL